MKKDIEDTLVGALWSIDLEGKTDKDFGGDERAMYRSFAQYIVRALKGHGYSIVDVGAAISAFLGKKEEGVL